MQYKGRDYFEMRVSHHCARTALRLLRRNGQNGFSVFSLLSAKIYIALESWHIYGYRTRTDLSKYCCSICCDTANEIQIRGVWSLRELMLIVLGDRRDRYNAGGGIVYLREYGEEILDKRSESGTESTQFSSNMVVIYHGDSSPAIIAFISSGSIVFGGRITCYV